MTMRKHWVSSTSLAPVNRYLRNLLGKESIKEIVTSVKIFNLLGKSKYWKSISSFKIFKKISNVKNFGINYQTVESYI